MTTPIIRYKLTRQDLTTYNDCTWTPNKWKMAHGEGPLCSSAWLHCYIHPLLAVLFNPIHANYHNPFLWIVEVQGRCRDDRGLKEGWTQMCLRERIEMPAITDVQRIAFGILCAKQVENSPEWNKWADNWLSGVDRSNESACAIYPARANCTSFYASHPATTAIYICAATYAAATADYATKITPINLIEIAQRAMTYK